MKGEPYQKERWELEVIKFTKYLVKVYKEFPGVIFQKLIEGFGNSKSSPELRMYYCGDEYQYSMCATRSFYLRPKCEGGGSHFPMDNLKKTTRHIMSKLPKNIVNGKELPRLLTRFDMGFKHKGEEVQPWVNEVEFVPGLHIDEHPHLIDKALGDQMVKIACQYCDISVEELAKKSW